LTILVLVILAGVWAAVLVPPWLQNRSAGRPADSISSFRRQLSVLERSNPGATAPSSVGYARSQTYGAPVDQSYAPVYRATRPSNAELRRRRRDVLFVLLGVSGLTFGLALLIGGPVWYLHLVADVLLVGYVTVLARAQRLAMERTMNVHYLPRQAAPEPALLYRRSGS
jgi:hypothetical protein